MILEDSVHKAVCDACGKTQYVEVIDDIIGYAGTVAHHTEHGGTGGEFFACGKRCVGKAVLKVASGEGQGVLR